MLRKLFKPNPVKFFIFSLILFTAIPNFVLIWSNGLITADVTRPWWSNTLMELFFALQLVGTFLHTPASIIPKFLPATADFLLHRQIVSTISLVLNAYLMSCLLAAFWDFWKKKEVPRKILVIYLIFWVLTVPITFFSFLLETSYTTLLICFVIFGYLTYQFRRYSKHVFIPVIIFFILFTLGTLVKAGDSFEEEYCLNKGVEADPSGTVTVTPTLEEAQQGFTLTGVAYREHMKCHVTFNLIEALQDKFLK